MKRKITKLDIHIHTPSSDGKSKNPMDYVRAIERAGLDGVCITDHHVSGGEESIKIQKVIRSHGFLCFRGCEYSTNDGHLLVYGVDIDDLDLGRYAPMQLVVDRVLDAGGVAIPSHPFYGFRKKLGAKVYQINGIAALEGYNGKLAVQAPAYNDNAVEAASYLDLPVIASSDAHYAQHIGTCYTSFSGSIRRPGELLEALRSGDYEPVVNKRKVSAQYRAHKKAYKLTPKPVAQTNITWDWDRAVGAYQAPQDSYSARVASLESERYAAQGHEKDASQEPSWWTTYEDKEEEDTIEAFENPLDDPFFAADNEEEAQRVLNEYLASHSSIYRE